MEEPNQVIQEIEMGEEEKAEKMVVNPNRGSPSDDEMMAKKLWLISFACFCAGVFVPVGNYAAIALHFYAYFTLKESKGGNVEKWAKMNLFYGCIVVGMLVGEVVLVGALVVCMVIGGFFFQLGIIVVPSALLILAPVLIIVCLPCIILCIPCMVFLPFLPMLAPFWGIGVALVVLLVYECPFFIALICYVVGVLIYMRENKVNKIVSENRTIELKE